MMFKSGKDFYIYGAYYGRKNKWGCPQYLIGLNGDSLTASLKITIIREPAKISPIVVW